MESYTLEQPMGGPAHYIVSEAANIYRSREQGIVASGSGVLKAGAVMAQNGAGEYVPLAPAAADGTQNAVAILWAGCDATTDAVRRTFTVRDTEVHADVLVWPDGTTDAQKTTAMAALADRGIIGR